MISIILTSYNRRDFLRESLWSLAEQDYPGTKQLILCDDGSTDSSLEMAEQFRLDFDDFKLIQEHPTEERRCTEVRYVKLINKALPLCTEKYITYATDDDLYHPERTRRMVEFLETHPDVYLAYHFMKIFRVTREQSSRRPRPALLGAQPEGCGYELIWDLCHEWNPGTEYWVRNIWNLIDHSSFVHRNLEYCHRGLKRDCSVAKAPRNDWKCHCEPKAKQSPNKNILWDEDPKFMRCGDWGFLLKALESGRKFAHIPEYLAIGRKIAGQSLHFDGVETYLQSCHPER